MRRSAIYGPSISKIRVPFAVVCFNINQIMNALKVMKNVNKNRRLNRLTRCWLSCVGKWTTAAFIASLLTGIIPAPADFFSLSHSSDDSWASFKWGFVSTAQAQTWVEKTGTIPESLPTAGNYYYSNKIAVSANTGITFAPGVLAVYSAGLTSAEAGGAWTFATIGNGGTLTIIGDTTSLSGLSNRRIRVDNGFNLNLGGEYTKDGATVAANAEFADLPDIGLDGGIVSYYAKEGTTVTYNGKITKGNSNLSTGSFNKTGAGTLILTHAGEAETNTIWNAPGAYNGAYNIKMGTLQINDGFLPGAAAISQNAVLAYNITADKSYTNTGALSGAGTLKKSGTGTLVVSNLSNISGGIAIDQGVLEDNSNANMNLNASLSGAGTLRKTGTGQLTINTTKSVAGKIDLQAGSLLANNAFITNFTSSLNVGAAAKAIFQTSKDSYYAYTGAITGSGTIQKDFLGTLVYRSSGTAGSGDSSQFSGTWLISGTLQVGNENSFASLGGNVVLQLKNDSFPNYLSTLHFITKADTTSTYGGTISEAVSAGGVLKKGGAGTLVLSGGPNSYTGGTKIEAGTLVLENNASLGKGEVALSGNATLKSTGTTSIDGSITGAGSLVVTGGTLTLNNENTYTVGTTIEAGTLVLTKSKSADPNLGVAALSAPVVIYKDGVLELNGIKTTGNVGPSPNDYSVYGGKIYNSSTSEYVGLRGLKLFGAKVDGLTSGAAPELGQFLLSGTISALAPVEVTVPSTGEKYTTGAVSSINADTIDVGFQHGEVVFSVAKDATLEVNANIIQNELQSGDIKKTGAGTLIFSKENSFNRTTTVTEGILKLTDAGTLGLGKVTVAPTGANGAELDVAREGTFANAVVVGGEGISRSGAIHFSENAELSGSLTLSTSTGFGADEGVTGTFSGKVANAAESVFAWYGKGDLRLTGDLSALDSTTIRSDGGYLIFASASISGMDASQVLTANTGGIGVETVANTTYTLVNKVTGPGSFAKFGDGELLFGNTGSNYTGGTYIYAGTLTLNDSSLPNAGGDKKYPVYVYDGATLKVTKDGAFGNASGHPSFVNLYGGTIDNNSTSHLTMTKVNLYGGTMESTKTSASSYGNFLFDDTISAYYKAPDGNVYNGGVSVINADSVGFYYRNTGNKYVFVDDQATLVLNSDIHKYNAAYYAYNLEKRGEGLLVYNGVSAVKISITGGGLLLQSGSVLNDTLTTAAGTTVQLGGTLNAAANINGDWYIDPESVNDVFINGALTLADTSHLLLPTENLNNAWSYDIELGATGSINGLTDTTEIASLLLSRMNSDALNYWSVGVDATNVVAYVDAAKVPEPSTILLLGLGFLGILGYRKAHGRQTTEIR